VSRTAQARSWLSALLAAVGPVAGQPAVASPRPGSAGTDRPEPGVTEVARFSSEPGNGRSAARLEGLLLRPPGAGPFPAVVMLHGCSGLRTRSGAIQAKPRFWAEHLRGLGYLALLVDSFTTRGIDEVCTGRHLLSPVRDRADDARGALRYLQARPDVRADGIGLLGWSNGAAAALSVLFDRGSAERDFRAAVAFYPNCTRQYPGAPDFRPYAPLYILVGGQDDWTPAPPCVELAGRARARGAPIAIKVYPGAHHGFDTPAMPVRYRPEVRNQSKGDGCCGATVGTDPAARTDAILEVTRFFAENLGGRRE
jgi:dienelactone hydrolase